MKGSVPLWVGTGHPVSKAINRSGPDIAVTFGSPGTDDLAFRIDDVRVIARAAAAAITPFFRAVF